MHVAFRNGSFARGQLEATRTINACTTMYSDLDGGDKIMDKWKDITDWVRLCGGRKHSVPQVQPGDSILLRGGAC